jgi:hypothetical protein
MWSVNIVAGNNLKVVGAVSAGTMNDPNDEIACLMRQLGLDN